MRAARENRNRYFRIGQVFADAVNCARQVPSQDGARLVRKHCATASDITWWRMCQSACFSPRGLTRALWRVSRQKS